VSAAATEGAPLAACDLLTAPIAKRLIGGDAHISIKQKPNAHMTHCQYQSDTGTIDLMVSDDWEDVKDESGKDAKPVPGIGDEANIDAMGLRVRKGTHGMEINASGPSGDYSGAAADAQDELSTKFEIKTAKALVDRL